MALPVAMVMSGLPHEQFQDDLFDICQHGPVLLNPAVSPSKRSTSESSCASCSSLSDLIVNEISIHHNQTSHGPDKTSTPNIQFPSRITRVSSDDSGFFASSEKSRSSLKNKLAFCWELIEGLENQFIYAPATTKDAPKHLSRTPAKEEKIQYQDRDLLELGNNMKASWLMPMQQHIRDDQQYASFTQYHPTPLLNKCLVDNCEFETLES